MTDDALDNLRAEVTSARQRDHDAAQLRLVGYLRVSSEEQARGGQSLGAQRRAIEADADRAGVTLVDVVADEGISAKNLNRPALQQALRMIMDGEADGLVATRLDRVSRSVRDVVDLIEWCDRYKVTLRLIHENLDTSTATGRATAHIMSAMAELQRELVGERTREVLADRKARGLPVSGPSVPDDVRAFIESRHAAGDGYTKIARALNEQQVPTARNGRAWHATTVASVLGKRKPWRPQRKDLPTPQRGLRRR